MPRPLPRSARPFVLAAVAAAVGASSWAQGGLPQPNPTTNHGAVEGVLPARNAELERLDAMTAVARHSGELLHAVTDLCLEGRALDLAFTRVYRSQVAYDGAFGPGWTHSYDQRIWSDGGGGILHLDGQRFALDAYPGGAAPLACATPGVYRKARQLAGGEWVIRDAHGALLHFHPLDGSAVAGKLSRLVDSHGNEIAASYDAAGRLVSLLRDDHDATSAPTRRVDLTWQAGRVKTLVDVDAGRTWTYSYDAAGRLEHVDTPQVPTWDGTATALAARRTTYAWEQSPPTAEHAHNLRSITGPGQALARITLDYDAGDHVQKAFVGAPDASGVVPSFEFGYAAIAGGGVEVLETVVGDRRGFDTTYRFTASGLARSIEDPLGGTRTLRHNADGELTRVVRPEGDERLIAYDSASADRFRHGNALESHHVPAPNKPGSASAYRVQRRYEPIYNQELPTASQGGEHVFDYQEDPQTVAALIADWAIATPAIVALGDVNGDGRTDLHGGSLIEQRSAPITKGLPGGATGPVVRVDTWTHDDFGRMLTHADPEGALTVRGYAGAYLAEVVEDATPDATSHPNAGTSRWTKPASVAHVAARTELVRDGRGNVLQSTDPRGVRTSFAYNALDEPQSVTYGASYDAARLDPELAALVAAGYAHLVAPGAQELFDHDAAGNLARIRRDNSGAGDAANPWIETTAEYDLEDRLTRVAERLTATAEAATELSYDASGNRVRAVDAEGAVEARLYDAKGRLIELRRAAGPAGEVIAGTAVTSFEHDANGNRTAVVGPADLDGDGALERTLFQFDGRNRLHRVVSPVGTESVSSYGSRGYAARTDLLGRLGGASATQNDTGGNVLLAASEVEHDEAGAPVVERALRFVPGGAAGSSGPELRLRRDRNGQVVEQLDPAGQLTTLAYDGLGRALSIADALGNETRHRYDAGGYLVETTHVAAGPTGTAPVTRSTRDLYDGLGRRIRSIHGAEVAYYAYDAQGLLVVRADGRSQLVQADPLGLHPEPVAAPGNTIRTATVRNAQGVLRTVRTDLWAGGLSAGAYDPWAAGLDPTIAPAGVAATETTTIQHDRVGNVVAVTSPEGRTMGFEYDDHGRMTRKHFPSGAATSTTYWPDGRVRTHALLEPGGAVFRATETSYDAAGRRVEVAVLAPPAGYAGTTLQTFEWNGLGRVTRATDDKLAPSLADSVVERSYDSLGRVLTETQDGRTVASAYDDLHRTELAFPGGRALEFVHDALGRLERIDEAASGASVADYDWFGPEAHMAALTLGNGAKKSLFAPAPGTGLANGYSRSYRPQRVEHRAPGGGSLTDLVAAFDAGGNRLAAARVVGGGVTGDLASHDSRARLSVFQKQFDAVTQLVSAFQRDGDGGWVGLFLQAGASAPSAYSVVPGDDWTYASLAGRSLDHDAAGNRTRDAWFEYEYDAFDRLVRVSDRYSGAEVARYSYDAETRRIEKHDWIAGTTRYVYDGLRILETRDAGGAVKDQYVHGEWIDELVQWTDAAGDVRYYLTDDMDSVVAVTDSAGNVLERVTYDAFGAPTFLDAAGHVLLDGDGLPRADSPLGNRFLFQGRDYDVELALWRRAQATPGYFAEVAAAGQYNFRYRYASPEEGRFTGRDPFALGNNNAIDPSYLVGRILTGESISPYEMHAGNPLDRRDPLGLSTITIKPGPKSIGIDPEEFDVPDFEAPNFLGDAFRETLELATLFDQIFRDASDTELRHTPCDTVTPPPRSGRGDPGGPRRPGGPETGRPGHTPRGPNKPGRGGGGRAGGAGAAVGIAVDTALSAYATTSYDRPDRAYMYLMTCTNPVGGLGATVLEDLTERIDNPRGLPQPTTPNRAERSTKLWKEYVVAWHRYEAARRANPDVQRPDGFTETAELRSKGKQMSCTLFSRNDPRRDPGVGRIAGLDCREAWRLEDAQSDPSGSGVDAPAPEPGGTQETARRDVPAASPARLAALERFDARRAGEVPEGERQHNPWAGALALALSALGARRLFGR